MIARRAVPRPVRRLTRCASLAAAVALAGALSTAPVLAQTAAAAPASTVPQWVWTTLPASGEGAKLEVLGPEAELGQPVREGDDETWQTLCVAPCAKWIASGRRLRVNGDFRVGRPFTLPRAPAITLEVKPASPGPAIGVMAVGGGVTGISGFVLMVSTIGITGHGEDRSGLPPRTDSERATPVVAAVLVGVGLATVGVGLVLLVNSNTTTVNPRSGPVSTPLPLARGLSISPSGLHF